ncbi:MAG: hypothetical protein H0W30_10855 [Gemmatimonadaceae bacterium]|nr:hypothetical protein [Gemmatimonadaceae bacterium]MDQ3519889.1 hypothetical protein [Gemmatimonadota bacterium]
MPGVADHRTIDVVTHDPKREEAVLIMTETRDWSTNGELLLDLQAKFQTYLHFIQDGQLANKFPAIADKRIRIRLDCAVPPGAMETEFLGRVQADWLAPLGIELDVGVLGQ